MRRGPLPTHSPLGASRSTNLHHCSAASRPEATKANAERSQRQRGQNRKGDRVGTNVPAVGVDDRTLLGGGLVLLRLVLLGGRGGGGLGRVAVALTVHLHAIRHLRLNALDVRALVGDLRGLRAIRGRHGDLERNLTTLTQAPPVQGVTPGVVASLEVDAAVGGVATSR